MTTTMQGSEMFSQMTGRAVEAFSMLAEANQKIADRAIGCVQREKRRQFHLIG